MSNDKYVALDVHQASIVAHVHDADDRCLTRAKLRPSLLSADECPVTRKAVGPKEGD